MSDDDTVITLESDSLVEGKAADNQQTQTPVIEKTTPSVRAKPESTDAVDALKSQYEDLQRSKQAEIDRQTTRAANAEAEVRRAREAEAAARTEVADTQLSSVESGLEAATTSRTAAKAAYKAAMEAGNWDAAAEAQDQLATAAAQIERLNETKADLALRKTQRSEQTETQQRQQPQGSDPIEVFIGSRTAPTQTWLRAHPDQARAIARFATGQATPEEAKIARKLSAASSDAEAEGYAIDTPEYFNHVETFTGLKKAATQAQQRTTPTRRQSVPAAPVNGGGGSSSNGAGPVEVRLTQGQSKAAEDGTHVWLESDFKAGRIKDKSKLGEPIGVNEMARRVYLMGKERPGIFENGNIEQ